MLNIVWAMLILISVACAVWTGRLEELSEAVFTGVQKAIELVLAMAGAMAVWTGMLKAAGAAGLTESVAKFLRPVIRRLFPDSVPGGKAEQAICMNLTANLFGMGNAATPMGIAAMHALEDENGFSSGNRSMVRFVVINTASLQLFPTSLGALRAAAGCANPFDILPAVWLVSALSLAVALAACFALEGRHA